VSQSSAPLTHLNSTSATSFSPYLLPDSTLSPTHSPLTPSSAALTHLYLASAPLIHLTPSVLTHLNSNLRPTHSSWLPLQSHSLTLTPSSAPITPHLIPSCVQSLSLISPSAPSFHLSSIFSPTPPPCLHPQSHSLTLLYPSPQSLLLTPFSHLTPFLLHPQPHSLPLTPSSAPLTHLCLASAPLIHLTHLNTVLGPTTHPSYSILSHTHSP